ncbi:MAG: head GIN domain-containing protein [Aquaticitalea sp.]
MRSFSIKNIGLLVVLSFSFLLNPLNSNAQSKTYQVSGYDKVIVSPHIEVVFKIGEKESVMVEFNTEPIEKFNVEVDNGTLELYLDDAKITTKSEKEINDRNVPLYKGTVIKAIVTYKNVDTFSLRGEESFVFESPIESKKLDLSIYGASQVQLNEVTLKELKIAIYGESFVRIDKGTVEFQQIRAYGESSVNLLEVNSQRTKLTAYGDGSFQFKASEELKVTSYGEPTVTYKGDAKLKNGLSFGEASIVKLN